MRASILLLALVHLPAVAWSDLTGRVRSAGGVPVEHARIRVERSGETVFSGTGGEFRLVASPPLALVVSHPRFKEVTVRVGAGPGSAPLVVVLEPKREIYEEIAVTADRGQDAYAPASVAVAMIEPRPAVSSVSELVSEAAAVSANGQGGLLQTYSVRGVARGRVLSLVDGMRVVSERRAGVSASFVDPTLLRSIDVIKGPSSTYYGSGALGGVVQLFPRQFGRLSFGSGVESEASGGHRHLMVGFGSEGWSLGLAHRGAEEAEAASGVELNSGFSQTSASGIRSWSAGSRQLRLTAIASLATDIGKSNTDFPERTTLYPRERHLLVRMAVAGPGGSRFGAWVHPQSLETRVIDAGGQSEVSNSSLDFGASWQGRRALSEQLAGRFGVDYVARRAVDAEETAGSVTTVRRRSLAGAREDELGVYGALEWSLGRAALLAGGRAALQRQGNAGFETSDDSALTAFSGVVLSLAGGLELVANLGTGLRFPSLSERFFSGTTGRGEVVSNVDLGPEASLSTDLGLRWYGDRVFLTGFVFRNRIEDYVERFELEPDVVTFRNLTSGRIEGLELEGAVEASGGWSLRFGGHVMEGRSDDGGSLADIPPDALFVGAEASRGRWAWSTRWERRFAKRDPGSGEKAIPPAELVSFSITRELRRGLALRLGGRNLLDERYFASADRKAAPAAGRTLALGVSWESR